MQRSPHLIDEIIRGSGDPSRAEAEWRLLEPLLHPSDLEIPGAMHLLSILGNSRTLSGHLLNHPEIVRKSAPSLSRPKGVGVMQEDLKRSFAEGFDGTIPSAQKILRAYKQEEMIRIVARDLAGLAPFEETGMELATLASASLDAATEAVMTGPEGVNRRPPATLGLGKLGGDDLNLCSDIDIIYIFGTDGADFAFYASAAERITRIMQERTDDGIVFRVDLNLRPEGKNGPIVNSIDSILTYYEVAGAPWERSALTKAHPVAGDAALGRRFIDEIGPFVYRRTIDFSIMAEIKALKEKINEELGRSRKKGFNVKLGRGGIREIEFFATAFQLVWGGKEKRLRERNTLKGLHAIGELGLVPSEEIEGLKDAYRFLRRVENRLQMVEEQQTHTVPTDKGEVAALARRMGFDDPDRFTEEMDEKTRLVTTCFERLAK